MKKIIAAFDGLKYSESTRDYAVFLAKQTGAHLVGVFLDDPLYTSYKVYELLVKKGVDEAGLKKFEAADKSARNNAAEDFEKTCQGSGLTYSLHHDHNIATQELKHETVYADLLIIDGKETLTHYPELLPTRFIKDLMNDAQCPVLIVPGQYKPIDSVVFLYDGEPASVNAIKMFSYLLSSLKQPATEVLFVAAPDKSSHVPDNRLLKEFMKRHFKKVTYTVLKGWAADEIVQYLQKKQENSLVVMGANQRNIISRWVRESMANTLMKELVLPLFIAQ